MQANQPWLSSRSAPELELNAGLLAEVLKEYRKSNGLTQEDLAQLLNFDQSYVSKIETGQRQVHDIQTLLWIAQRLNMSPTEMGLSKELLQPVTAPSTSAPAGPVDAVKISQQQWRRTRRYLNRKRNDLTHAAADLYQRQVRIGSVPFLARPEWMPDKPIRLEDIRLDWSNSAAPIAVTGAEPEADRVRPLRTAGRRFDRYTSAIRYLDKPALFENRASYRLLGVDLSSTSPGMTFCLGTYFDKLDVQEAIAHEFALVHEQNGTNNGVEWADLPLRSLIGDPCDLGRRAVMPAIETLTLRRQRATGNATFLLHWRDPAKVATAAGIYGLIPAGEFQPSSIASWDRENDFDLWRNIVREYSEELLGEPERDGSQGEPLNYDEWPLYRTLRKARTVGRITTHFLGIGLDPLTLTATILTVAVMDDDVFDSLFDQSVRINAEGILVTAAESTSASEGIPFNEDSVRRLLTKEPMVSSSAYILDRAWHFRGSILGS